MNEHTLEQPAGMNRRTLLRNAAVGGAAVWAAPAVTTLGRGFATSGTLQLAGCEDCQGQKPSMLQFTYDPHECTGVPDDYDGCEWPLDGGCTGGTPVGTASITVTQGCSGSGTYGPFVVAPGDSFQVTSGTCTGSPGELGLGNCIDIEIVTAAATQVLDNLHTSCSAELLQGMRFGSLVLDGGIFDCGNA